VKKMDVKPGDDTLIVSWLTGFYPNGQIGL
jgi:hypothetical protein